MAAEYDSLSSGSVTYGSSGFTATEPSGAADGVLLVLMCTAEGSSTSITEDSGSDWTLEFSDEGANSAITYAVFTHMRGSTAPNLDFTISPSYAQGWVMVAVTGADDTNLGSLAHGFFEDTTFSATSDPPSVTCGDDDMAIILAANTQDTFTYSPPSGYTEVYDADQVDWRTAVAYKENLTSSSEDVASYTAWSASFWHDEVILVIEAGSSAVDATATPSALAGSASLGASIRASQLFVDTSVEMI